MGQHFLRQQVIVDEMIKKVDATGLTVLEIGCGDGFLTRSILASSGCKKLICVELDSDWADYVRSIIIDDRLTIINQNILEFDWNTLSQEGPIVLLANLPYNITFPILNLLIKNIHLFSEGVFMVQDEVAQKLVAQKSGVSAITIYMQAHLDMEAMRKIGPEAFSPPPKVNSRTVYFKKPEEALTLDEPEAFWKFVKSCFHHSRQTLRNNFKKSYYPSQLIENIEDSILEKRAQHLKLADFLKIWHENRSLCFSVLPGEKF